MMKLTRREWHRFLAANLLAGVAPTVSRAQRARAESRIAGVLIGVQSYSFRDRDLQGLIDGMVAVGVTSCELWEGHVEPRELRRPESRADLERWRLTVPLDHFRSIRARFERAGLSLNAYNLSFRDHFSDAEIDRGFAMAHALGVSAITASAQVNSVPRIARMAARHGVRVGMHNHSRVDPNEFSGPDDFARAMTQGQSIAVNLDIGHFTAANHDAVAYLREHHERTVTIHLKDRRRDDGPNVAWGEGDTPLVEILRLLRNEGWGIPANIEYEYPGGDPVEEVRRCFQFCRRALEA